MEQLKMIFTSFFFVIHLFKCGLHPPSLYHHIFLNPHEDGVLFALPLLITTTPSEDSLSQFLFIAWYIWKARNDIRFQRKKWTSFHVLVEAQAHRKTHVTTMEHHQ
jgi:ABC-type multidrug transport system permease subunit